MPKCRRGLPRDAVKTMKGRTVRGTFKPTSTEAILASTSLRSRTFPFPNHMSCRERRFVRDAKVD